MLVVLVGSVGGADRGAGGAGGGAAALLLARKL